MTYRGYTITAEVESYDVWSVGENGEALDWIEGVDGIEVVGYNFLHGNGDSFYQQMDETDGATLRRLVDIHLSSVSTGEAQQ